MYKIFLSKVVIGTLALTDASHSRLFMVED